MVRALLDKGVLRSHQKVITPHGDGEITSGTFSPTLKQGIGLALLLAAVAAFVLLVYLLRDILGRGGPAGGLERDTVTVIETHLDDSLPEVLGTLLERLGEPFQKLGQGRLQTQSWAGEGAHAFGIDVDLLDRRDIPSAGAGEAAITLVAPAIASAVSPAS